MSKYKFAFIVKETGDYIRRPELEFFKLDADEYKFEFTNDKIAYTLEDVNCPRADKIVEHLNDLGYTVRVKSHAKHYEFENLNDLDYIQKWISASLTNNQPISQSVG